MFLDGYKELNLCLCSHQHIRDVMMQRMQVSKLKKNVYLIYGTKQGLTCGTFQIDFDVLSCLN